MKKTSIKLPKNSAAVVMGVVMAVNPITLLAKNGDCFDRAAAWQNVNANILRAISIKENHRCDATIRKNKNGSVDRGCMQINSIHLPELSKYGVTKSDLLDSCKNIFVAARHYKKKVLKYGNTWAAVGAYHSETLEIRDSYAADVYKIWLKYGLNRE
jgi:hypothetical protein